MKNNNTINSHSDVPSSSTWHTTWTCKSCRRVLTAQQYGGHSCACGAQYEVCAQPYGSKRRDPYVIAVPK